MSNLKEILINKKICKSVWFMRQAGRYLPEFRKIRSKNKNFIDLCLNSKLSSTITLQPIEKFNLDSATTALLAFLNKAGEVIVIFGLLECQWMFSGYGKIGHTH